MNHLAQTLSNLPTEQINTQTQQIDTLSSFEIASLMNAQDTAIIDAVRYALPQISQAIDCITEKIKKRRQTCLYWCRYKRAPWRIGRLRMPANL